MTARRDRLPLPTPAGLRKPDAAAFCGLTDRAFAKAVDAGQLPRPKVIGDCKVWSVSALQRALDDSGSCDDTVTSEKEKLQCDAAFLDSNG